MSNRPTTKEEDHGWAWVVLSSAVMMTIFSEGIRSCIGIFYSQFIDTFSLSPPQAAGIGSVLTAAFYFPGPLVTVAVNKIGARYTTLLGTVLTAIGLIASSFAYAYWSVMLTFGFVTGLGLCFTYLPTMGALPRWFIKRRALAMALCTTFGACGMFIFPPLVQALIDAYTWRGAVIILAGISLHCAITGMTFIPQRNTTMKSNHASNKKTNEKAQIKLLFKDPAFVFHCMSAFFMFAYHLPFIFIVRHVVESRDMTANQGAVLVSVGGMANCAGRVLVTITNFHKKTATKTTRFLLFNGCTLFAGLFYVAIPWLFRFTHLMTACGLAGFMAGIKYCTMMTVTIDVTTQARFQTGYGFTRLVSGISMLMGSPFAGYLAGIYRSYDVVFYFTGICLSSCFILGMTSFFFERRKDRKTRCFPVKEEDSTGKSQEINK